MQIRRIPIYLVGCMVILAAGWAGAAPPKAAVTGKAKPVKGESDQERRACRRRLQAELKDIPSSPGRANDILTLLAKQAQMKLKVDWASLAARNIKKDKMVTVKLAGCTIGQGLDILLAVWGEGVANMGYYIDRGVIHVTTATAMRRISLVRTYDVSDLIRPGTDKPVSTGIVPPTKLTLSESDTYDYNSRAGGGIFGDDKDDSTSRRMDKMKPFTAEGIVRVILETVDPNSWGIRGSICPMGPILLIDQSIGAHGKIEALLAMIRRQFRVSGLMRTLTVQAQWVWLDVEVYAKLTSGKAAVAIVSDDIIKASKVAHQGVTKCFNGQAGNLTSGNAQNVVLGYEPIVAENVFAYRPIVEMVQWGAVLDFKVDAHAQRQTGQCGIAECPQRTPPSQSQKRFICVYCRIAKNRCGEFPHYQSGFRYPDLPGGDGYSAGQVCAGWGYERHKGQPGGQDYVPGGQGFGVEEITF